MLAVVSFATMPTNPTQPEEIGLEDESPEDEAQRSAERRHGGLDDEGRPYHVRNVPTVEPVTEDESRLVEEYRDGESPGRR